MEYTVSRSCQRCGQSFFYVAHKGRGRKRWYCDACAPIVAREATRARVRRHRDAIRQQTADDTTPPRPSEVGTIFPYIDAEGRETMWIIASERGLFSDLTQDQRNEMRRMYGLPLIGEVDYD